MLMGLSTAAAAAVEEDPLLLLLLLLPLCGGGGGGGGRGGGDGLGLGRAVADADEDEDADTCSAAAHTSAWSRWAFRRSAAYRVVSRLSGGGGGSSRPCGWWWWWSLTTPPTLLLLGREGAPRARYACDRASQYSGVCSPTEKRRGCLPAWLSSFWRLLRDLFFCFSFSSCRGGG